MRYSLHACAAVLVLAMTAPAFAGNQATDLSSQSVVVQGPGVGVRIGDGDRYRDRDRYYGERRYYRDRHWRAACRTIVTRDRVPGGTVIIRKRTVCD